MWIRVERGVRQSGQGFLYVLGLLNGSFGLFLCIFGSIWPISHPKQKKKLKIPLVHDF